MGKESDYLFHCLFLDNITLIGREHGDGSMVAGAWRWEQYFSADLFSKKNYVMIQKR